eukprot:TRINITY_DN556_c0_g1_i1.p1 TRINITY_DN556_c0_g1~~TRINITY_DN556_c0_g1_i1.p1  ORF type:complete len:419 (+),score=97.96 TRINITY_DN556_c0_g1_i1:91-1257(+)
MEGLKLSVPADAPTIWHDPSTDIPEQPGFYVVRKLAEEPTGAGEQELPRFIPHAVAGPAASEAAAAQLRDALGAPGGAFAYAIMQPSELVRLQRDVCVALVKSAEASVAQGLGGAPPRGRPGPPVVVPNGVRPASPPRPAAAERPCRSGATGVSAPPQLGSQPGSAAEPAPQPAALQDPNCHGYLTQCSGPYSRQRVPVVCSEGGLFTLGRAPSCSLQVATGADVARVHCCIRYSLEPAPHCVLYDMGAQHGLYLNGVRVAGHTPLRGGDVIMLHQRDTSQHFVFSEKGVDGRRASPTRMQAAAESHAAQGYHADQSWRSQAAAYRRLRGDTSPAQRRHKPSPSPQHKGGAERFGSSPTSGAARGVHSRRDRFRSSNSYSPSAPPAGR